MRCVFLSICSHYLYLILFDKSYTCIIVENLCTVSSPVSLLFTASTDKTIAVWDIETGDRQRKLKGHQTFVNTVSPARRGPELLCSGSDDGTVKVCYEGFQLIFLIKGKVGWSWQQFIFSAARRGGRG